MGFSYAAYDTQGQQVAGVIDAMTPEEASEQLHARGLFVTQLDSRSGPVVESQSTPRRSLLAGRAGNTHDLMMFAQQAAMMLRAGSRIVPALEAYEDQVTKPAWRKILTDLRSQVEQGASLSKAVASYPEVFNETWRAIISAGESTGRIEEAFDQLSGMTKMQHQIKVRIVGALVYPAALLMLSFALMGVLMFFVLPRFGDLYTMLNTPLPGMTNFLLTLSVWARDNVILVVVGFLILAATPVVVSRFKQVRVWFDALVVKLPMVGRLVRQMILAKIFRVWGTSITSNVPLLESLELSQNVTSHALFNQLLTDIIESVSEGDSIGECLMRSPLVPRTMSSAISTGEQSGQLGQSLLFLADYMDEENSQLLATLTRLIEPLILVVMGVTVGAVAISLFLPLFDLTSAM